jgi:hypothetical protein
MIRGVLRQVTRREAWRRLRDTLGMPLLALVAALAAIWIAAAVATVDPRRGSSYVRWDAYNYITIALYGYSLDVEDGRVVGGNAAWFPAYPLAIRAIKPSHLSPAKTGRLISSAFAFALLVVIWRLLPGVDPARRAVPLLLAAFFPGFIYYHAVFPISMAACLGVLAIACSARRLHLAAGTFGALAAASYTTGFLLGVALTLGVVLDAGLSWRGKLVGLVKGPALVALGLASVFLYQERSVGWDGFFRMQRDYCATERADVVSMFLTNTRHVWAGNFQPEYLFQLETVLVAVLMVVLAVLCWRQRRALGPLEWLLFANAVVFWAFPHLVGPAGRNSPRADALLVGMTPLLARLPFTGQVLLLVVFAALGTGISIGFFTTVVI